MTDLLSTAERDAALAELSNWTFDAETRAVSREFRFADFTIAFAFMSDVAAAAEQADHHPDWSNSYDRVRVALTTHSAGGLTHNDIDLARAIDAIALTYC